MRVVKPSSANSSPRGSGLGRRKTVMTDRRRMQVSGAFVSNDGYPNSVKSNRPVSWHPPSQFVPQQTYQQIYQGEVNIGLHQISAAYSGYTSPDSTFSPVSMPYTGYEQQQYTQPQPSHSYYPDTTYSHNQHQTPSYLSTPSDNTDSAIYSHFDWSNYNAERSTAPPTPEAFLPIQHPEPSFPAEEPIPYHSLSTPDEEEGEILCGLGLYDTPSMSKLNSDPHLDNYRSSCSQLLGRREPTGKGLKLEETWNPPASDDEDDEEQDGECEEEEVAVPEKAPKPQRIETDFTARNANRIS